MVLGSSGSETARGCFVKTGWHLGLTGNGVGKRTPHYHFHSEMNVLKQVSSLLGKFASLSWTSPLASVESLVSFISKISVSKVVIIGSACQTYCCIIYAQHKNGNFGQP